MNSAPDQIDSSIFSNTEPDATDFSYKNIKYQKIKDILLKDIKKDVCNFIQNEIRQKINLYSLDEHQTLVDKRIIANLEKEIHFLKAQIETKNEIIKNFIKNGSHRNENNNLPQDEQIWESDENEYERSESDPISTCDRYAAYDTRISSDSNTNEISTVNRNIDEQLKAIREEKQRIFRALLANLRHKKILLPKQTKRMTETMNSPMIRMTTMKLTANKMKETISFVGHQEHAQ